MESEAQIRASRPDILAKWTGGVCRLWADGLQRAPSRENKFGVLMVL